MNQNHLERILALFGVDYRWVFWEAYQECLLIYEEIIGRHPFRKHSFVGVRLIFEELQRGSQLHFCWEPLIYMNFEPPKQLQNMNYVQAYIFSWSIIVEREICVVVLNGHGMRICTRKLWTYVQTLKVIFTMPTFSMWDSYAFMSSMVVRPLSLQIHVNKLKKSCDQIQLEIFFFCFNTLNKLLGHISGNARKSSELKTVEKYAAKCRKLLFLSRNSSSENSSWNHQNFVCLIF